MSDSIRYETGKRNGDKTKGYTPYCILGLRTRQRRTIKHILNLSYLKIAFFLSLIYDSYAGKVFLHFVQSIFSKIFTLPAPKKIFSSQKKSSDKKVIHTFSPDQNQINKRVPIPPKIFLYFLKFGMLE